MSPRFKTVVCLLACVGALHAQRAPLFKDEILPVLEKHCTSCHNPERKMGGLDLSTFTGMMNGGGSGPVIAPGHPQRSLLWLQVDSGKMPLGGKLPAASKQLLRAYIEHGRFPSQDLEAMTLAREAAKITPEARAWWSFQKPVKPAVPELAGGLTPIDAFVLQKLRERGWGFRPEAERRTLIRRATLDLTGLPPTPAEIRAFVDDKSPNAYEKLLDRLLASPAYGEQWGRHWLDIAGYSDSLGDAGDVERETSWKYRDYVVRALNANKPVDRFLVEQLAGDQLTNFKPGTRPTAEQREALIATGYLRTIADITDNQTIYEVDKYFDALQKTVETSLTALMGVSVGCARCHDHKFDPILQRDYFKLTAVYQATWDPENWLAASVKYGPWPSRMVLDIPDSEREAWIKNVTSNDAKTIRRLDDLLEATYQRFRKEATEGREMSEARRVELRKIIEADPDLEIDRNPDKSALPDAELEKRFPELLTYKNELLEKRNNRKKKQFSIDPNYIEAAFDVSKTPSPTYMLTRGNYLAPGAEVKPGIPAVLDDPAKPFAFPDPAAHPEWNHTGRRLTLAQWLTHRDHPLTARVFVNRVWQFHFGEGIVRSVDDFGRQGEKPSHPELLDYLAVQFQDDGWDLKRLHKQIMMSAVYRQSSAEVPEYLAADPSAKLLWRKPPLRLEAEAIRDSLLMVSGQLNREIGGAPVPLKRGKDGQWMEDPEKPGANRRSIYLIQTRTRPVTFLHAFDAPTMTSDNQTQRFRSALPTQSLALMNGPLVLRTTKTWAAQLMEQTKGDGEAAIRLAVESAYGRPPSERELALGRKAIADGGANGGGQGSIEALRLYLQAITGANSFLYSY